MTIASIVEPRWLAYDVEGVSLRLVPTPQATMLTGFSL